MASTYLTRTISSGADVTAFTISVWVKRSGLGSTQRIFSNDTTDSKDMYFRFGGDDTIQCYHRRTASENVFSGNTNAVFRDTNGWYHIVLTVDSTESTASDRFKLYVNGVSQTFSGTPTYPDLNEICAFLNTGEKNDIGYYRTAPGEYFEGSMSHFHLIQGTAYQASTFGSTDSTTGEWKINTSPSVTYGTNGFFILKDGNSVTDQSGNGNNFTVGGGTLTKTEDCPSNIFATLNPLDNYYFNGTFSQGNTQAVSDTTNFTYCTSTFGVSTGKWYWEVEFDAYSGGAETYSLIGITSTQPTAINTALGDNSNDYAYYSRTGQKRNNTTNSAYGTTYTTGDIIGVALDLDNNKLYFSKNGTWQNSGDPTSGATGTGAISITAPSSTSLGNYFPALSYYDSTYTATWKTNFGNGYFGTTAVSSAGTNASGIGIFEYDVPTGYTALSTKGLNE